MRRVEGGSCVRTMVRRGAWITVLAGGLLPIGCASPVPARVTPIPGPPTSVEGLRLSPWDVLLVEAPSDTVRARHEPRLADARAAVAADPSDLDAAIWIGRELAYLGRYRDAIDAFSMAMVRHPDEPRLLRHRGHRFITTRQFGPAVADLARAWRLAADQPDRVEADGLPNAAGIPRSTLHTNILYHLGLAHFLRGDRTAALGWFTACDERSPNDDMRVAARAWRVACLVLLDRSDDIGAVVADVTEDMDVIENDVYHRLLLVHAGRLERDALGSDDALQSATGQFGQVILDLRAGADAAAQARARELVTEGPAAAFGVIAAEALADERDW